MGTGIGKGGTRVRRVPCSILLLGLSDLSTYWGAYSDPSKGQFNNATPELIPIPDEYYLPALKIQWDFAGLSFISNSSYYHRNETDSYQGTGFDLAYYQTSDGRDRPLSVVADPHRLLLRTLGTLRPVLGIRSRMAVEFICRPASPITRRRTR